MLGTPTTVGALVVASMCVAGRFCGDSVILSVGCWPSKVGSGHLAARCAWPGNADGLVSNGVCVLI